jgi:hypothetical protein
MFYLTKKALLKCTLRKERKFIMKSKKFLSMLLALAMILSMGVSVFAADEDPNEGNLSFEGTATVKIPAIKVSVPKTATLFINPMGFEVNIASGDAATSDDEDYAKTSNQIVSPVNIIKNSSPMKLSVGVIGSVTPADTNTALALSATPIGSDDTKNTVFIYANFGTPTGDDGEEVLAAVDYAAPAENATSVPQLALTNKAPSKPINVGTINAGGDDATKFAFQFLGECNPNAKNDWNNGDKVTVNLAFTFKPVVEVAGG